ncbi:hypothetical protein KBK19_11515 [Microvirga sp. STR05]|uniref:DUF4303 domain-containing protein n=1 Tax=Hymenobacter duratus TaxID=2771356 RepID=A0ABR8JFL3_9BACT|nr:hypothetical protein [Hymenobacter duratus]MBD2715665.1 hypothetical protein [Hymenobacter duratus]MBR7950573.1 hypothetical protein [Microvirga sp. STR05]
MPFDKSHYIAEMKAMVTIAIQRMRVEYRDYEVYTMSIWTDPNEGTSSINFDSKTHSDQLANHYNQLIQKHYDSYIEKGDYEKAKLYAPVESRNDNPAVFELADFVETQHVGIELNWEYESDGKCWNILTPLLQEVGDYAFEQVKILKLHSDFELAVNGPNDWYELTWPK